MFVDLKILNIFGPIMLYRVMCNADYNLIVMV